MRAKYGVADAGALLLPKMGIAFSDRGLMMLRQSLGFAGEML